MKIGQNSLMKTWTLKYQPQNLSAVIGQTRAVSDVHDFWRKFNSSVKNAVLLHGPPGCGKTSMIYALAQQENLELVEINASNFRNREHVEQILKPATQQMSLFGTKKIILVDEIDGMSGQKDRGGVKAVIDVIKDTKFPIFMTANDGWSDKLRAVRKISSVVSFDKINYLSIAKYLQRVCQNEDIEFEELALKKLAMSCNGDLRAAINDLQVMASTGKITNDTLTIWGREREEKMQDALKLIFKSFDSKIAMQVVNDLKRSDDLNMWLEQNIPAEYSGSEIDRAYDAISWSDIFSKRIRRRQHWRFLVYVKILAAAGVQQAKDSANRRPVDYKRPGLILFMWRNAAKRKKAQALANQIAGRLHCSAKSLRRDFMPYLEVIENNNKEMYNRIADSLGI
jgi:replication factor C large subunit